jgi:hypothetical protein
MSGHRLAVAWQTCLSTHHAHRYQKPITQAECGMLKHFRSCVPDEATEVIEFVHANWSSFIRAAKAKYGLFGSLPDEPSIPFFVKYHDSAVNLMLKELQSIAKKKAYEEELGKRKAQREEAAKIEKAVQSMKTTQAPEEKVQAIEDLERIEAEVEADWAAKPWHRNA